MIEHYRFGSMTVSGETHTRDIKIISGRVIPNWRRRSGHMLDTRDISDILDSNPDILIVGTGAFGMMRISESMAGHAEASAIRVIAAKTAVAVAEYNRLCANPGVCACFHLTC